MVARLRRMTSLKCRKVICKEFLFHSCELYEAKFQNTAVQFTNEESTCGQQLFNIAER